MLEFIKKRLIQLINEEVYYKDNRTAWLWVSPSDKVIEVPKLNHKDYIMRVYKDEKFSWDYDRVFDKALKDGWVRAIYEYYPDRYYGELSLNGYDKKRVVDVLKYVFGDLIKYGNKSIYIDFENQSVGDTSLRFSTYDNDGKRELNRFLNQN